MSFNERVRTQSGHSRQRAAAHSFGPDTMNLPNTCKVLSDICPISLLRVISYSWNFDKFQEPFKLFLLVLPLLLVGVNLFRSVS